MQDRYDVAGVIQAARQTATDISPADRQEWKLFCCALKVLGYDESTFVALSSCPERDARRAWREERNPGRYATEESAKAKIIALAKNAGMDLRKFLLSRKEGSAPEPQRHPHASTDAPRKPQEAPQRQNTPQPNCHIIPGADVELGAANVRKTALFVWLCKVFGEGEALKAVERYRVGASRHATPEGYHATAFPLINTRGECIDIKIMHLNPETGSRKTAPSLEVWKDRDTGEQRSLPSTFAIAEVNKFICRDCRNTTPRPQCPGKEVCTMRKHRGEWAYFGEHLLADLPEGSAVAVVESEKTALVASIVYPEFIWIATGSISNLNPGRMEPLKPYAVTIFPDRDGATKWEATARELAKEGFNVKLDVTLHRYPGDPKDDLADIIINFLQGKYATATQPQTTANEPQPDTPTDEGEGARDADGNFIPWRLAEPQPTDPAHLPEWIADRAAWRLELREQCNRCRYAQVLGGGFKGCRLNIPDEEAASRKQCRGFSTNQTKIV